MKRTLRSALTVGLAVLLGAPLSAQQATLRLPPPEPAEKGQQVVVTTRDGREITGKIGNWIDDVGFQVRPADGRVWLIHPEDVVSLRDAATGLGLAIPQRTRRWGLSGQTKFLIGLGVALLVGRALMPSG